MDHPPYVIAEIGVNHDGKVSRALELTEAAADARADAVKLQYFETDRLMSKAAKLAAYQKNAGETDPIAMLRRLELTLNEMAMVVDCAHERGIHAIVTVFSTELVDAAETLAWDAYKTASPDIVNKPLLERLAQTGKPMVVSTGASTLDEVVRAVGWLDSVRDRLAVLQCVSSYPAPDAALGGIRAIAQVTNLPVGYSDHTNGPVVPKCASALGAVILEKHITYSRSAVGPDHAASIPPVGFRRYVEIAKRHGGFSSVADRAYRDKVGEIKSGKLLKQYYIDTYPELGAGPAWVSVYSAARWSESKQVFDCERDVRTVSRQSVGSARDIPAGTVIGPEHLAIKRPGTGILAYRLDEVIGKTAARDIEGDVPIVEDDLVGGLA
ncbi:MAG: N-acetylneuraminate synthase family protein [Phycisphaerales bacterium]